MTTPQFPPGFLFGTATASYQIEGAVEADGRRPSIWDTFSHTPGRTDQGDTGDVACDHYHRYAEDVALMQQLGAGAYRFSVAWPRVIPTGTGAVNQAGLDFYSRLVDSLLESGIRPFATLYHWDLPQDLQDRGGWQNRDIADWYAAYAAVVVGALGDRVHDWITLNEPWCSAFLGHTLGSHAPGHHDQREGVVAAHHLMLAHGSAIPAIRAADSLAQVAITLNLSTVFGPENPSPADADAVRRVDNAYNGVFLGPLFDGQYPAGYLDDTAHLGWAETIHDGDLEVIGAELDWLGVNNYFPVRTASSGDRSNPSGLPGCEGAAEVPPREPLTAMGWEQSPAGFAAIVERAAADSGLPVQVTENGSAWDDTVSPGGAVEDPQRVAYLRAHLEALSESVAAGTDIRGYFAWSLLDNFEWSYGYAKRFGLIRVDYDTQARTIKESGREYARIIAAQPPPVGG